MSTLRKVEIFSAGCPACKEVVNQVRGIACPACDITVLDMHDDQVAARERTLGIQSLPAVAIDGRLADCCASRGIDLAVLREAGIGSPTG